MENATYDSVAFRFVTADEHPDHGTLNTFRKCFRKEIEALMVQVMMITGTLGVLKLGNIALDGSKIKANASRHSTLSNGHIKKLVEQLIKVIAEAKTKIVESGCDGVELEANVYSCGIVQGSKSVIYNNSGRS